MDQVDHSGCDGGDGMMGFTQFRREDLFHLQMTFSVGTIYLPSQSPNFLPQGLAQGLADHLTRGTQIPTAGRMSGLRRMACSEAVWYSGKGLSSGTGEI